MDIFSYDIILVPIHLSNPDHWCLAVIDFRTKAIKYYDSLGGKNNEFLDKLLDDYLVKEMQDKKKETFEQEGWTLECLKDIPQQQNGSDCGVFVCQYANSVALDKPPTFTQSNMPDFRQSMAIEILNGKRM